MACSTCICTIMKHKATGFDNVEVYALNVWQHSAERAESTRARSSSGCATVSRLQPYRPVHASRISYGVCCKLLGSSLRSGSLQATSYSPQDITAPPRNASHLLPRSLNTALPESFQVCNPQHAFVGRLVPAALALGVCCPPDCICSRSRNEAAFPVYRSGKLSA